jgi:hypothetical protein
MKSLIVKIRALLRFHPAPLKERDPDSPPKRVDLARWPEWGDAHWKPDEGKYRDDVGITI